MPWLTTGPYLLRMNHIASRSILQSTTTLCAPMFNLKLWGSGFRVRSSGFRAQDLSKMVRKIGVRGLPARGIFSWAQWDWGLASWKVSSSALQTRKNAKHKMSISKWKIFPRASGWQVLWRLVKLASFLFARNYGDFSEVILLINGQKSAKIDNIMENSRKNV